MQQEMNTDESMTTVAARTMLEAMRKLSNKEITTQEAQGIAMLGKGVIDAANVEVNFIRTMKAMPSNGGMFGKKVVYLEPKVEHDALAEQTRRLKNESRK